ncbi:BTB/POZ domain-containing protein POB1 [Acorus gramineus]|uniref:BTB/POZ domain-containing protein POB1 n=1 Tax=Acorus gramineus TaxID=55184 RepID=A0AAV9B4W5_ACOGR|nr:BTB/POZ domain-containing protein POB1 [Acorus gramineus]
MRETDPQCEAIIKVDSSEAVALVELLHYMYGGELSSTMEGGVVTLVDMMLLSDKFGVVSCTDHCIRLLKGLPMTQESATIYLEIASHVLVKGDIQPLVDAAKKFLATQYKNVMKCEDDLCNLTLPVIEAIISGEGLRVPSEDQVYDMVVKWAQEQFPDLEERRIILGSCITRLVHFSCLSPGKLKDILARDDLDRDFANDVVREALFFKAYSSKEILDRRSTNRGYTRCIYYFDLSLDQCKRLKRGESIFSGRFYLGKQSFCLQAMHRSVESSFGLYLQVRDCLLKEITVNCTFSTMKKPEMDFMNKWTTTYKFTTLTGWGYPNLFKMPWVSFVAKDNPYFINEMLHLRAEVIIIE